MFEKYLLNIVKNEELLIDISNQIWNFAETGFQEFRSSKLLADVLEENGFKVFRQVAEMPTAFYASYGDESPIIAVLGEYDALPGLSQAPEPIRKPLKEGAPGHGCGHNLLGTGSLGGALAVKEAIDDGEVRGTIRYYGCPAEEIFNSKGYMIKHGLFDDVDITLSWHPSFLNSLNVMSTLAMNSISFKFLGRTAHAAADPQNGRSALDAVELMNIGVNYLREHVIPNARLHYVITNGGKAPNVVPDEAEVWYFIRAPERHQVENLYERVINIAKGAELMTDTKVMVNFLSASYNTEYNAVIKKVVNSCLKQVGAPKFKTEEKRFARELVKTLPENSIEGYLRFVPLEYMELAKAVLSKPLNKIIIPPLGEGNVEPGSTDVADVSWVSPLAEFTTACEIMASPGHSWQNVATAGMSIGHKGMLTAAKILALSAMKLMKKPHLIEKAKIQFEKDHKDKKYRFPFPKGHKPLFEKLKELNYRGF